MLTNQIEVVSRLGRIGYENVIGFSTEISSWIRSNKNMNSLHSIYANDINQYKNNSVFLDVRKESELFVGSVANSINIPLDTLFDKLGEIARNNNIEYVSIVPVKLMKYEKNNIEKKNAKNGIKNAAVNDPLLVKG